MISDIKPTRSELTQLKLKIGLAKGGYALLKKKRDGLILDFFEVLNKVKKLRSVITQEYNVATEKMNTARLIESDLVIKSLALAISNSPEIEVRQKNIMGITMPRIGNLSLQKSILNRGYGLYNSAAIDEAAEAYEKVVEKIAIAAEVETSMRRLLKEIEKTKRRVNALEFDIIPNMEKAKSFIQLRLEEVERENLFRMKRIKKKVKR